MKWQKPDDSFYCVSCGDPATISDHITPVRPDDREGVLREAIESMCRPCPSANTVTAAHVDGTPATVEGAQTPVMSLHEELTAQLGGFSGTVVAVPWISSRDLAAQRTSYHKNAEVFVGADGHVNSIRIGAPRVLRQHGHFPPRVRQAPSRVRRSNPYQALGTTMPHPGRVGARIGARRRADPAGGAPRDCPVRISRGDESCACRGQDLGSAQPGTG